MAITNRRYKLYSDFFAVSDFLRKNFSRYELGGNHCQSFWEYAHTHPAFNHSLAHRFGVWEEDGDIVGVASYELDLGEAFFACERGYEHLKPEMLDYAERELSAVEDGSRHLDVCAYDYEHDLKKALADKGYKRQYSVDVKVYDYSSGFAERTLPDDFSVISLEDENDPMKIHNVLWKGFDHGPEPDGDYDCRLQMQTGPSFSKELTTIIKAPDGEYACFAGMWMDGVNDYAYLEPLATAPEYRGMGLAAYALQAAMKKTQKLGATYCIGGSDEFYTRLGFRIVCATEHWKKTW
ncbi:MAG TPA: GNAT family N-acetyltransferase [Spirochaetales bacterium]|nr:GNAT family N-acetyltransferase [Spirochaetales bacterium]